MKRIGILTGGGDCPGLNAVIRGVVLRAAKFGMNVVGFRRGWQGLLDGGQTTLLSLDDVEEIHSLGGTIIGTSRTDPFAAPDGPDQVRRNLEQHKCQGLIVVGGEKTLGAAYRLYRQGMPIVGVPKTIDNNVAATDYTFGFVTAINTATDAIDRLTTTAKSHGRVLVVEVMGRNSGWLALYAGMAGGAHQVLVPEKPFDVNQVCERLKQRFTDGSDFSVIVAAEGARPADPKSLNLTEPSKPDSAGDGIAKVLAQAIAARTGLEAHHVQLGPLQRGGSPTAFDRVLGLRLGLKAAELVHAGKFGMMTSLSGTEITAVPLEQAIQTPKTVGEDFAKEAAEFFD
jgi:6-phosphofructokinase 1